MITGDGLAGDNHVSQKHNTSALSSSMSASISASLAPIDLTFNNAMVTWLVHEKYYNGCTDCNCLVLSLDISSSTKQLFLIALASKFTMCDQFKFSL